MEMNHESMSLSEQRRYEWTAPVQETHDERICFSFFGIVTFVSKSKLWKLIKVRKHTHESSKMKDIETLTYATVNCFEIHKHTRTNTYEHTHSFRLKRLFYCVEPPAINTNTHKPTTKLYTISNRIEFSLPLPFTLDWSSTLNLIRIVW